jgi:hypothetical protein
MLTFVRWFRLTKIKGLPGPDKTYPDSASCPHTYLHTLPDLANTSPLGRLSDLTAWPSFRPRCGSVVHPTSPPLCRRAPMRRARPHHRSAVHPTSPLLCRRAPMCRARPHRRPAVRPPRVCPTAHCSTVLPTSPPSGCPPDLAVGPPCVAPDLTTAQLSGPHVCARPLPAPMPVAQLRTPAAAPTPQLAIILR